MKHLFTSIALSLTVLTAFGQQDALVSKNVFNGLLLNPAYGGTHQYFTAGLLYRNQWTGFTGAPATEILELDGPIAKDKMGVGLMVSHDKIGVTDQTDVYASYSYKLQIGPGKLSMGLRGGISNYTAKVTSLTVWDAGDQAFTSDVKAFTIPKFGFGMYYYAEKYYAGFAIPTLIAYDNNYSFSLNVEKSSAMRRHYYLNGGYIFNLNESTFKLKPTLLLKYAPAAPVQMDISTSIIYKDFLTFGVAFRTGDALIAMLEYRTSQNVRIAYAYDFTMSKLRTYSGGSHEIMLSYDFGAGKNTNVSPRYF